MVGVDGVPQSKTIGKQSGSQQNRVFRKSREGEDPHRNVEGNQKRIDPNDVEPNLASSLAKHVGDRRRAKGPLHRLMFVTLGTFAIVRMIVEIGVLPSTVVVRKRARMRMLSKAAFADL